MKSWKWLTGLVLSVLLMTGCGGIWGGSGGGGSRSIEFQSAVIQLPHDLTVVSRTSSELVVSGLINGVDVGSVLIFNPPTGGGWVAKVTSVAASGGRQTLGITPPLLTDIVSFADISEDFTVPPSALIGVDTGKPNVRIEAYSPAGRGLPGDFGDFQYTMTIADEPMLGESGEIVGHLTMTLPFRLGVRHTFDVGTRGVLNLQPEVRDFRVEPYVEIGGVLEARGRINGSFSSRVPLCNELRFNLPFGGLPWYGSIRPFVEIEGEVDAEGELHVTACLSASAGVRYHNGSWQTLGGFEPAFSLDSAEASAEAVTHLSPLQLDCHLGIDGLGFISTSIDPIRMSLEVAAQANPAGLRMTGSQGFLVTFGGQFGVGPLTVWAGESDPYVVASSQFGQYTIGTVPGGRIVFQNLASGEGDVQSVLGDGTGLVNLTPPDSETANFPAVSKNGSKVIYLQDAAGIKSIVTRNADGTGKSTIKTLASGESCNGVALNANATKALAAIRNSGGDYRLVQMNVDGTNPQTVTTAPLGGSIGVGPGAFRPSDGKILYHFRSALTEGFSLMAMTVGGSPETMRTNAITEYFHGAWHPTDPARFAYAYSDSPSAGVGVRHGDAIGDTEVEPPAAGIVANQPAWSPNGKFLVYTYKISGVGYVARRSVAADGSVGSTRERLTPNNTQAPSWGL